MIDKHLHNRFLHYLGHAPTADQALLLDALIACITNPKEKELILIKGYAGTGKTLIISSLVKLLSEKGIPTILLSPTGRAAKVFSSYANAPAYTIHKKIYRQRSSADGFGHFVLNINLHTDSFFIVDEASMIPDSSPDMQMFGSGKLLSDLIDYVYSGKNCRLILSGDTAQLPPVGLDISPALDVEVLKKHGLSIREFNLTQVVRQAFSSSILHDATEIRRHINKKTPDTLQLKNTGDIECINHEDLLEKLTLAYDKEGMDNVMVICRSNKQANRYNEAIRRTILWQEEPLASGDMIMIVKNNYHWLPPESETGFLANGDIARITRIHKYHRMYDYLFADVTIEMPDYDNYRYDVRILVDTLQKEGPSLSAEENKAFFFKVAEDYRDEKTKKKIFRKVREDDFFNALQIKFAYATTCHKAQGGQWKHVFIDQGYLSSEQHNIEYLRWLYTAYTRATERLYLITNNKKKA